MKDNAIDVEVVPVETVRCPRCGARNRVLKQERQVGYRCGGCRGPLANPFERLSIVKRCFQGMARRNSGMSVGKLIAAFMAALIVVAIAMHSHGPPANEFNLVPTTPASSASSHSQTRLPPTAPPKDLLTMTPGEFRRAQPEQTRPVPPLETPAPLPRSLENGTILLDVINAGHSEFTVENGTERDAVIKLIDSSKRQTVVVFYVTAHNMVTADLIPEGTFTVLCGQGVDWDDKSGFFTRKRSFQKFEPDLDFTMRRVQSGNRIIQEYKHNSLQLEPSITGGMRESDISEKTFMEY